MRAVIQNRKGQNIVTMIEIANPEKGLAFVIHGLSGFKEQPQLEVFAEAFKENGYTVVRFDTTNTFGESDGQFEDATTTNYYEDLEDVISWASEQVWYREPFALVGHSIGGLTAMLFAEKFPEKVKALAPISTVVSGTLLIKACEKYENESFREWKQTGITEEESTSRPGVMKRLKWSFMEDIIQYDVLPKAKLLKMPVLLIIGEKDRKHTEDQNILYEALSGPKELHVIKDAPHTFTQPKHLNEIKEIFDNWIEDIIRLG